MSGACRSHDVADRILGLGWMSQQVEKQRQFNLAIIGRHWVFGESFGQQKLEIRWSRQWC